MNKDLDLDDHDSRNHKTSFGTLKTEENFNTTLRDDETTLNVDNYFHKDAATSNSLDKSSNPNELFCEEGEVTFRDNREYDHTFYVKDENKGKHNR